MPGRHVVIIRNFLTKRSFVLNAVTMFIVALISHALNHKPKDCDEDLYLISNFLVREVFKELVRLKI